MMLTLVKRATLVLATLGAVAVVMLGSVGSARAADSAGAEPPEYYPLDGSLYDACDAQGGTLILVDGGELCEDGYE
jgi:hypothetical protein